MGIDRETVKYAAHLARMELEPVELDKLSKQLQGILEFIDKLKKLDIEKVPATSHILSISNVLRNDVPKESLPQKKALMNAPVQKDIFFSVPKVIE